MTTIIMIAQLLLGLSLLVIIHELGHFMAARAFGIKVEKFYLFMDFGDFRLFKFKKGDTEYGVGWAPIGGYVKIVGMIDESMDKDFIGKPAEPWEFRSKPVWQRMIVIMGGIIMNIILGFLIFGMIFWHYGEEYIPAKEQKYGVVAGKLAQDFGFKTGDSVVAINGKPLKKMDELFSMDLLLNNNTTYTVKRNGRDTNIVMQDFGKKFLSNDKEDFLSLRVTANVGEIEPKSPAEKAGLKEGDRIVVVNGDSSVKFFDQLTAQLQKNKGKSVNLMVARGTEILRIQSGVDTLGHLGFKPVLNIKTDTVKYGLAESFAVGASHAWNDGIASNAKAMWKMITNHIPASKSLHGPVGIAKVYGGQWVWHRFWLITGLLSMVLAFMNFLPIPALDGGYIIYLIVEAIRGKALSYRFLEIAQMVGMVLLFLIMGFALFNDIRG